MAPNQDVSARISFFFALERLTGVQEVDQNSVVRRLAGMQEHQGTTPLWHAGTSIDDGAVAAANPQVGGSSARSVSHTFRVRFHSVRIPNFSQSGAPRNERLRHGAILWEAQLAPIVQGDERFDDIC